MLNKVTLIGRLSKKPEVKYGQSGKAFCTMDIATDESYTGQDGQRVKKAEWHKCVCYDRTAENCGTYLDKGSLVYVEGSLTTRKWQDQSGQDRYVTEIKVQRVQFLDRKQDNQGQAQGQRQQPQQQQGQYQQDTGSPFPPDIDDCPFS